jgi:hypothetical protein
MDAHLDADVRRLAADIVAHFGPCSLSKDFIDANFEGLPLLSSEEFTRQLPCYMLRALECWDAKNDVCEFTIYSLSPGKEYLQGKHRYWADRYELFTRAQIDTILRFLALVEQDASFGGIFSQVKRAPERIRRLAAMEP